MDTLSECVFVWTRREFARMLGVCEQEIRAETPLSRFLPRERRRQFWRAGEKELGLRFPTLVLPASIARAEQWLTLTAPLRSIVFGVLVGPKWLIVPMVLVSTLVTTVLFYVVTLPWATEHPDLETFGDFSNWLLARNMKRFRQQFGLKPNHDEIFITIKAMLVEMGVEAKSVTPDASFTELIDG